MSSLAYSLPMHFLAGAAALGLAGHAAAAAGLQPATPDEIVAGAKSCAAATSPAGVDQHKLEADGWRHATVAAGDKPVGATFYGKGDLLLTLNGPTAKVCFVTARIKDSDAFGTIGNALNQELGVTAAAKPDEPDTAYWFPPDHIVQMQLTGKPDAPAVRIAVGYNPSEKQ